MNIDRKRAANVTSLLAGYSALLIGLGALTFQPLAGVLAVLCGLALSISSAVDLIRQ